MIFPGEWIIACLIVLGSFFSFVAGVGLLRLPDVLIRMHASTKAGTLGVGLTLTALMMYFGEETVTARCVAAISFIFVTAPVAAHIIGRAAYQAKDTSEAKGETLGVTERSR